jgi:hypothetical protein
MSKIKVKDHSDLYRDKHSKAIVSTDQTAYQAYLMRKKRSQRIDIVEEKVTDLQNDIHEIKQLLQQLVLK